VLVEAITDVMVDGLKGRVFANLFFFAEKTPRLRIVKKKGESNSSA